MFFFSFRKSNLSKSSLIREFRLLQILNAYINASLSIVKTSFVISYMMILQIIGYFGVIRFYVKLPFHVFLFFPMVIFNSSVVSIVSLLPTATEYKMSQLILRRLRNKKPFNAGKIARREIKSFHEFGIRFGMLKAIKFPYISTFLLTVSNYTISLLVTFP